MLEPPEMAAPDLSEHYANYYGHPELARWRDLGARDKAANVVELCDGFFPVSPRVAEIGCGDGALMAALDVLGFASEYVGFEISVSGAEAAQKREFHAPMQAQTYNGARVPAEDREFDLVIVSHVLEHVLDPRTLIAEAARIGGRVFIEVPLELNVRTPHDFVWTDVGHINLYNPKVVRHLVQSMGLHIERERITTSSRAVSQALHPGWKGDARWLAKRAALRTSARLATALFTYNASLVTTLAS